MANSQETNVNLKINRVPDKATLEDMVANNQIQPNQLYMIPSEQGQGLVTMQTKVLWENSSPSSSFAGQSINVEDMSKYDYLLINFLYNNEGNVYYSQIKKVGKDFYLDSNYAGSTGSRNVTRAFTYSSNNSLTIGNCMTTVGGTAWTTENTRNIPTQIIGIKLIESPTQITNKYSTEETVVGEWIDGKKIYRKVFNDVNILCASAGWKEVGTVNFDTIINSYFICNTTNETTRERPNCNAYCNLSFYNNKCYIAGTGNWSDNTLVLKTVVVEYTKTTD